MKPIRSLATGVSLVAALGLVSLGVPAEAQTLHTYWADSATASSESGSAYGAMDATGEPDHPDCADGVNSAWSPATGSSDPEQLKLTYDAPTLLANQVDIYKPFAFSWDAWPDSEPVDFVTQVDLEFSDGSTQTIFTGPDPVAECPGVLSVPYFSILPVQSVTVTTQTPDGVWEYIDAVGLSIAVPEPGDLMP